MQLEPWLRGTHTEIPAVLRGVVHALELAGEDIDTWCSLLSDDALNARPAENPDQIAPVAFHLRHIVRSLDRLLTSVPSPSPIWISPAPSDAKPCPPRLAASSCTAPTTRSATPAKPSPLPNWSG